MIWILRRKFRVSGRSNPVECVWKQTKASSARRVKSRLMGWAARLDRTRIQAIHTRIFWGTHLENSIFGRPKTRITR
jgi:transposase